VQFPRPRTLEMTYEPAFVDAMHRARLLIGDSRVNAEGDVAP
jgi:hypothetical protein